MRSFFPLVATLAGCIPVLVTPDDTGNTEWSWEAPDNDWPMGEPPFGLVGEGFDEGQVVPDFRLLDQHGQTVSMWQFYGMAVVLDVSTIWCGPCQALAEGVEETYQHYSGQGFIYLTILAENLSNEDPTQADLNLWADTYGITAPVLADVGKAYTADAVPECDYPLVLVIDREMEVSLDVPPQVTDDKVREGIDDVI